jgi:hypothetical protein
LVADVAAAIGGAGLPLDRAKLAARAARVSLAAREPRLRTFALRLRDPGLSEDAWAEALGSFVVGKPPKRWLDSDEEQWRTEISRLFATFMQVEVLAFRNGQHVTDAIRVAMTRSDGTEVERVVEASPDMESETDLLVRTFEALLPKAPLARLAVISRLLWNELGGPDAPSGDFAETTTAIPERAEG